MRRMRRSTVCASAEVAACHDLFGRSSASESDQAKTTQTRTAAATKPADPGLDLPSGLGFRTKWPTSTAWNMGSADGTTTAAGG